MKCPSIVTLWSSSPPPHLVTVALSVADPPSLYTGASDGSIVWWKLPGDPTSSVPPPPPLPLALLLGHSSTISALSVCSPQSPSLLSACSDSVLCIWTLRSAHCRRRRRLPPWAGSPSAASPVPSSPRYVCIASHAPDGLAVLILDSCELNVVQTVAHGSLPPLCSQLRCARVIEGLFGDAPSVVLADAMGNSEAFGIQKELEGRRSAADSIAVGGSSESNERAVWVDVRSRLLAAVFGRRCVFKVVSSGLVLGEISLEETPFCGGEDSDVGARFAGGLFLQSEEGVALRFLLWSNNGAAVVYAGRVATDDCDTQFSLEPMCHIPASSRSAGGEISVIFCESGSCLLRMESCCTSVGDLPRWRPFVMIWSIPAQCPEYVGGEGGLAIGRMVGEGSLPVVWDNCRKHLDDRQYSNCLKDGGCSSTGSQNFCNEGTRVDGQQCDEQPTRSGQVVLSSMVLSKNQHAPYGIVYGFDNGNIEVTRFWNPCAGLGTGSNIAKQVFIGHTDGVVCLAAHCMVAKSREHDLGLALISGSLDCTVRVWDMDKGSVVAVLHHHVGPVRQIILPPQSTSHPWSDCFFSVGEDCCVALISLDSMRVERMLPGHPSYPTQVVWDHIRGYVACLCKSVASHPDSATTLCIWDVKTGARERVFRGTASQGMFDHFCGRINVDELSGNVLGCTSSASLLHLPMFDDAGFSSSYTPAHTNGKDKRTGFDRDHLGTQIANGNKLPGYKTKEHGLAGGNQSPEQHLLQLHDKSNLPAIRCSCPLPGIAVLNFELSSIISLCRMDKESTVDNDKGDKVPEAKESLEGDVIRFSLAFLHLWDIDPMLDALLMSEMNIIRPDGLSVAAGISGDKGSVMLAFPGLNSTLELWKSSDEFCAMRSLTIVSLAQRLITLSHPSSSATSALAAFYTRNFAEKFPCMKPPLLQILVSFWQDASEHVRMAARSLFHCAAPRAVPEPFYRDEVVRPGSPSIPVHIGDNQCCFDRSGISVDGSSNGDDHNSSIESDIIAWLESYEMHDWASSIGGTPQDAMASNIIVAAALAVWYPSIVKTELAKLVVHPLIKLVMVVSDYYSSTAAELLSEGMDSTWKPCIVSEIPRLIGDVFFQIECLSVSSASTSKQSPALAINVREALIGILLPSLAMADISGFLHVIERQIWVTSSDSPVHLVSLKTLIRVIRGSPKSLAPYLDKVVDFILLTMDPANLVMRKVCLQTSTAALKEVVRMFPMVAVTETFSRLAVGDAIGDINNAIIRVYDLRSLIKIKVLDASGPPGFPVTSGTADATVSTAISVVSFSPDGEGLVAFSEQGLIIRWWSLGTAWWEKLSRNMVPTQCTKLIFVPPWVGFSPNSSRSSVIASILGHGSQINPQENEKEANDDTMKILLQNLDLSYRLEWSDGRKVALMRLGQELGSFQF